MDNPTQPVSSEWQALADGEGVPVVPDLTGRVLGDFRVRRRLGEGGMGQVYLAEQSSLKRPIALKILKADLAGNPKALKRFKAEAEAIARATHPNIVQVYSIGEQDGIHFMALEFVDGLNLRDYLTKKGTPDVPLALSIMRQGAAALQAASELGIIHRDIKPDNILLTRKGAVKVTDFGLSRFAGDRPALNLTQSGVAMGTPLYMSPEQVEGKELDPRTDIYSFGVTCYHMLAGHPPFRGQTAFEVALQHVQAEPEPLAKVRPDLPPTLCALVHKMMAKQPEGRHATAREVLKDLAAVRNGTAAGHTPAPSATDAPFSDLIPTVSAPTLDTRLSASPGSGGKTIRGRRSADKWLALALGSVLLALVGAAYAGWRSNVPPAPPEARPNGVAVESPELRIRSFQKRRELHFLDAIREYANPQGERDVHNGLRYSLALSVLYFEQWRLDDADDFFATLRNNPYKVKEYATLGKLGHAIILAFPRDDPGRGEKYEESIQSFLELVRNKNLGLAKLHPFINRQPAFLQMIAKALDYDKANYEGAHNLPFPKELEDYRKTRPLPQKPNPANKPPNKGQTAKKA